MPSKIQLTFLRSNVMVGHQSLRLVVVWVVSHHRPETVANLRVRPCGRLWHRNERHVNVISTRVPIQLPVTTMSATQRPEMEVRFENSSSLSLILSLLISGIIDLLLVGLIVLWLVGSSSDRVMIGWFFVYRSSHDWFFGAYYDSNKCTRMTRSFRFHV